ncbi:unnamed protein product [Ilex paraguariensis]|uniref:Potassium transporter n=1 Tax=Ilex paraguariensis TaxID=185542 RepID=A0ABC8U3D3_9AQUA
MQLPNNRLRRASMLKSMLEKSHFAKFFLLFATMLGTSMVIGDALSAVGGIKEATSAMTEGAEALFADVGHFTVRSIQISPLYWPMFVVAVLAAIIASQAMISGTFSIIQQSLSLRCFPRVKIIHTSAKYEGQVYIPEINYLLMVACVAVTLGFRTTEKIGNAYGIAVVFVMTLTSGFLVLIMIMIWKTHILLIITYILVIGSVELLYLSSVPYKFNQGGRRYYFKLNNKVSPEKLKDIVVDTSFCRIPGLAIFYSELVHGIPPIFKHYVANVPVLHSVLIFSSIKSLPISKVPEEERFLFRRAQPNDLNVFRCIIRFGYTDIRNGEEPFERMLIERLKEFIREDLSAEKEGESNEGSSHGENADNDAKQVDKEKQEEAMEREIEALDKAWRAGVVHLVGEHEVVAGKGSGIGKRILINYAYNFLKRNIRQSIKVFDIPQKRMLKVGMTYEL